MPDYLLEIGTEELPAAYIPEAQKNLEQLLGEALRGVNLPFREIGSFSTPRRLTVIVKGLEKQQETTHKKQKGPPTSKAFDASGAPTKEGAGFAQRNNVKVEYLARETVNGVEYIVANITTVGKPANDVLSEIVPKVIAQLSGERMMRWASYDFKFSRPIRWIVSLLDNDIVPIEIEGVPCGRKSAGHRMLSKGSVTISNAHKYADELKEAYVIVDPDQRRKIIEQQVTEIASSKSGVPKQLKGDLLEEVVHITEWPHAVAGQFSEDYLQLPDALIETVMVHHQRYFPIEKKNAEQTGKVNKNDLLPWFITIANNDRKEAEPVIKQGNERVLRARLADGKFFYFDDQKTKLTERKDALKQLTFQHELGSYADKVDRLVEISIFLTQQLQLDSRLSICLEETAKAGKLDLVTNLVRELPELQGYVGSWYAEQEGLPPEVVTAIASHYSPRSTEDSIAKDTCGQLAAVADKVDNLVCLFAIGKKPSGSSDPYALRRQAQGLIDILMDGLTNYPLNLTQLMDKLLTDLEPKLKNRKQGFNKERLATELHEFLNQRLRGKLLELGAGLEVIDAVLSAHDPFVNLPDVSVRCTALGDLMGSTGGLDVVRIANRLGRILDRNAGDQVDSSLFSVDQEKALWETFNDSVVKPWQKEGSFTAPRTKHEYETMLNLTKALVSSVDSYFEKVMVNDKDDKPRSENRHAMLKQIDKYFSSVADFTKLQSLLA